MSLSFLPRGVAAKKAIAQPALSENDKTDEMQLDVPSSPVSATTSSRHDDAPGVSKKANQGQPPKSSVYQRKPPKPIDPRHLAVLIETSMSDYALWVNKDLRRYAADKHTKGFIPLSRLLDESPIIQAVGITPSESAILQALKEYGTGFLEMQMKVINSGKHRQVSLSSSTYNIRRIDWETIREKKSTDEDSMSNSFWDRTIDDWNSRTIYIENIPRKYWTLPSALYFVNALTGTKNVSEDVRIEQIMETSGSIHPTRIQHLELPAHAKASDGDIPVCKGFAFVTFGNIEDMQMCLMNWPWVRSNPEATGKEPKGINKMDDDDHSDAEFGDQVMNLDLKEKDEHEEAVKAATQSRFKCMTFKEWADLKVQYLERQASIYNAMKAESYVPRKEKSKPPQNDRARAQDTQGDVGSLKKQRERPPHMASQPVHATHGSNKDDLSPGDVSYPPGCLLFVKNLHPQTNKTTLKALFGNVLKAAMKGGDVPMNAGGSAEVDYVDWSKGMSSCHIRVSHPIQSQAIVSYLAQTTLVQSDGNDATMRSQSIDTEDETRPLVAELVQGRAESIYWEKVPEKIRRVAITKSNRHNRSIVADNNGNVGGTSAVEDAPDRSPGTSGTSASKGVSEEPGTEEREKKRRRRA